MGSPNSLLAVRAIIAIYREFEQTSRRSDISMAQYRMMLYLRKGPKRAGVIAAAAAIAKPTVSLSINALRDKGWVMSVADIDGRASVFAMTAAGKRRMARFERKLGKLMRAMVRGQEFDALCEALAEALTAMAHTRDQRLMSVEQSLMG